MNSHELHDQMIQVRKLGLRALEIEQKLQRALHRERAGTTTADGYRTSTGGGRGGGMTILVDGEDGEPDRVPVTSVESAALARLGKGQRDRHRELTRDAVAALVELVAASQKLQARIKSIDDLTSEGGPAPKRCECCAGKRGMGNDRHDIHRGTCGDRLDRRMDLCRACRSYVDQTATAGSRQGELPADEAIRRHEETGRWRIRTAANSKTRMVL